MGPDALMRQKMSKKRHREGYEEGVTILFRPISALHFIASDTPVQVLGQYSKCAPPSVSEISLWDCLQCLLCMNGLKVTGDAVRAQAVGQSLIVM